MKFWDSSALVPLLISQEFTKHSQLIWKQDSNPPLVWWESSLECLSALARLERDQSIATVTFDAACAALKQLSEVWHEIQPTNILRDRAHRLLRVHPLRAADAQQLAAALIASEDLSAQVTFVCFDQRLSQSARREGFRVVDQQTKT